MRRLALPGAEPRGALVVDLDLPAGPLRIVAAHLGLLRRSRRWQVRSILDAIEEGPRDADPAARRPQRMAAGPPLVAA